MALTRHATGNSRPRKQPVQATSTTTTTKTTTTTRTKKPLKSKAVTGARVAKSTTATKAAGAKRGRKPGVRARIEGALEKAVGTVEGRPGKKAAGTRKMNGTDGRKKTVRKL